MQSNTLLLFGFAVLALPLACSESPTDDTPGTGGSSAGSGGAAAGAASGGTSTASGGSMNRGGGAGTNTAGAGSAGTTAGSAGSGEPGDDLLFVPEDLPTSEMNAEGGLTLVALTLIPGPTGPQLFAAVRNDGETPACEAGIAATFKDKDDQVLTSAAGALVSGRYYRLDGGTGAVISCVPAGEIAMTSSQLPEGIVIEELGSMEYTFPAFTVTDIVAVEGLDVSEVQTVMTASGYAFTGTVSNDFTETLSSAKLTLFTLNRVGRPLGVATKSAPADLAPGESWSFQTNSLTRVGVDYAAFATASYPF